MKSSVIAAICVTLFCISGTVYNAAAAGWQCEEGQVLYQADLTNGDVFKKDLDGFTIKRVLQPDAAVAKGKCNLQDVLKVTFPEAENNVQKRMLKLDLEFNTPLVSGYAFHVGDSPTNKLKAICSNDGSKDTPIIGVAFSSDLTWTVHANNLPGHWTAAEDSQEPCIIEHNYINSHVTLYIGDDPSVVPLEFKNKFILAALSGQGKDYIAVGMNRLIDGEEVDGAGLCHITITACDAPSADQTPIKSF